jgi:hypothetical protein
MKSPALKKKHWSVVLAASLLALPSYACVTTQGAQSLSIPEPKLDQMDQARALTARRKLRAIRMPCAAITIPPLGKLT